MEETKSAGSGAKAMLTTHTKLCSIPPPTIASETYARVFLLLGWNDAQPPW